jgi:hypothetical protein
MATIQKYIGGMRMNGMNKIKHQEHLVGHSLQSNSTAPAPASPQADADDAPFDFNAITPEFLAELEGQGITPDKIAEMAVQSGVPVPQIIQDALTKKSGTAGPGAGPGAADKQPKLPNLNKYPSMLPIGEYNKYKKDEAIVKKNRPQKRATTFGYMFSDLLREDIVREMKRTQGSFLVGVNLVNLFNEFRQMIVGKDSDNDNKKNNSPTAKSNATFKKVGEYLDANYDDILEKKLGFRDGSDISHLPEIHLDRTSTFDQIIDESKQFAAAGYKGEITPAGLIIMVRMLYKYKKNNAQWVRVATVLELIYKYLGGTQTRHQFFKNKQEISVLSLMELEEFYNTDHIFMSETEIQQFKKNLEFYKSNLLETLEAKISMAKLKLQKS